MASMTPRQQSIAALIARLEAGDTVKSTDLIDGRYQAGKLMVDVRRLGYPIITRHKITKGAGAWWQHQAGRFAEYKKRVTK